MALILGVSWAWLIHPIVLDFWAYLAATGITILIGVQLACLFDLVEKEPNK